MSIVTPLGAGQHKTAGAYDRWTFEQGINGQRISSFGPVDIEFREIRKFFRFVRDRHIERDRASRKPILALFANRAKIIGAEKSDPIVLAPVERAIARFLDAQTGEARALRKFLGNRILRHFEIALIVDNFPRAACVDDMHFDRFLKKHSQMKKAHRKPARPVGEKRMVHVELDFSPGLVIDLGNDIGRRLRRADIRLARHALRHGVETIEGKWHRRAELHGVGGEAFVRIRCREYECGGSLQHRSPVKGCCHLPFLRVWRPYGRIAWPLCKAAQTYPRLGGEKGAEGFLADGFVANRGPHKIIEEPKAAKSKSCLDDAADKGIELQEAAERPSRRPGRADHFRADQNGNRHEGRNMDPVDLLRFSHSGSLHLKANSGKSPPPRGHPPLYYQGAPGKPLAEAQTHCITAPDKVGKCGWTTKCRSPARRIT